MRKYSAAFLIIVCCFQLSFARSQKYKIVKDGKHLFDAQISKKSAAGYLNVSDIARIYGVLPHFYPVSKKAVLRFANSEVECFFNSVQISVNGALKTLDVPTFVKKGALFVPLSLIASVSFSEVSKYNAEINEEKKLITLTKRVSVRRPEILSYQDYTRVIINFDSTVNYNSSAQPPNLLVYEFYNGFCGEPYEFTVDDGVINSVSMSNSGKNARLVFVLNEGAGESKEFVLRKENMLFVDLKRTPLAIAKSGLLAAAAPAPEEYLEKTAAAAAVKQDAEFILKPESIAEPESAPVTQAEVDAVESEAGSAENIELTETIASGLNEIKDKVEVAAKEIYTAINKASDSPRKTLIVLDPGHGGRDPGAIGALGTKEKDLNLKISKIVAEKLKKNGYNIKLTRDDDSFVALMDRIEFANRVNADYFISIHCNSSLNSKKRGFEVYFLSENASDPQAEATAKLENAVIALEGENKKRKRPVQEVLFAMAQTEHMNKASELCGYITEYVKKSADIKQYNVKQAGFFVLKGAQMPAVLVECGYISNKNEESNLNKNEFQHKVAEGILQGVKKYKEAKN